MSKKLVPALESISTLIKLGVLPQLIPEKSEDLVSALLSPTTNEKIPCGLVVVCLVST
jgi:hypothetical protein